MERVGVQGPVDVEEVQVVEPLESDFVYSAAEGLTDPNSIPAWYVSE